MELNFTRIGDNPKRNRQSTNADQKSKETVFSIAMGRQMAIENTVSIDFQSTFLDSIGNFDCHLLGVK